MNKILKNQEHKYNTPIEKKVLIEEEREFILNFLTAFIKADDNYKLFFND